MADKKTTQETLRTPIDGSELVRLATSGANWQAPLSSIFSTLGGGGGGAAAPQFAIQFNNPLGTLDGDVLARFDPASGLTLGGAIASAGEVTPGSGTHVAMGNYAVVDYLVYSAGDPVNEFVQNPAPTSVLLINERHVTPLDTPFYEARGISSAMNFVNQTGFKAAFVGHLANSSVSSDNINNVGDFVELELAPTNYNPVNTERFAAVLGYATNSSAGEVTNMYGMRFDAVHQGSGTVSHLYGIDISAGGGFSSGLIDEVFVARMSPIDAGGSVDFMYGCYIVPMAGIGTLSSYNIVSQSYNYQLDTASTIGGNLFQGHSAFGASADVDNDFAVHINETGISNNNLKSGGATSLNVFEGIIRFGTATNSSPQNGDVWFDGTNLKLRTGGATKTFTVT